MKYKYKYTGIILKVVDGDTIDVDLDLGFRIWVRDRFRLYGINAPEMSTPEGVKAKKELEKLLPVGKLVNIDSRKDKKEKYGRWLAIIKCGSINVNKHMLESGNAVEFMLGKEEHL